MNVRATVTIKGLVQGVAYRHCTTEMARELAVTGWVRNLPNGDVQGCFEGDAARVESLIDWCRSGPSRARVERVDVENGIYSGEFSGFTIKQ